jgi:putative phage-type endonuclease
MNTRYRIVDLVQGSQEWHDFRKGKIGASMAPVIMGVSPFQTRLQLWEEIIFGTERLPTRAMERGTLLEEKARAWLNAKPGLGGVYIPRVVQMIDHPQIISSLDGYYVNEGRIHAVEIKCPGMEAHLQALEGKIPDYYYPQLQHQMHVLGIDQMLYVSFDGENGVVIPCEIDVEYCNDLMVEEHRFLDAIENLVPPEACNKDWVKIYDPSLQRLANMYQDLSNSIEEMKDQMEEIKKELISNTSHPRSIIGSMKLQKVIRKGSIDYDRIFREHEDIDCDSYRKAPIESWRITSS